MIIRLQTITQNGFRPGLSTMHAVTDAFTPVYDSIHDKKYSGLIFDIQKAFGTVDHRLMIAKLQYYGIRGTAKNLFESNLHNR